MNPHTYSSIAKPGAGEKTPKREERKSQVPAGPYVGKPLDDSQYHDVIEEQIYSEQRPCPEEEQPIRSRTSQDPTP